MKIQPFRPLFLALVLPSCLALPGLAEDSINNTVLVKVPASVKFDWKLSFVSGQGSGDAIKIVPVLADAPTPTILKAAGDTMVFKPGKTYSVFFTPNFGKDGSKYVVKLTDSYANCKECTVGPKKDQYVTFKAEKPVSTLTSSKSGRKLTLTPDWSADKFLIEAPGQGGEDSHKDAIAGYFQDSNWTLSDNYF